MNSTFFYPVSSNLFASNNGKWNEHARRREVERRYLIICVFLMGRYEGGASLGTLLDPLCPGGQLSIEFHMIFLPAVWACAKIIIGKGFSDFIQ